MINPPWLFDAHSLVPTTFAVSMKSSMNIATRLAAVTIDDAPSVKGIQLELQPTCAHEKRSCLSPKFPVELECMIYSHLSVRDLKNLTRAYPRSSHIIADNNNSRQIARKMIARDSQRLRDQIEYLNFSGMSLVTAFRRWIQKYGLSRAETAHRVASNSHAGILMQTRACIETCRRSKPSPNLRSWLATGSNTTRRARPALYSPIASRHDSRQHRTHRTGEMVSARYASPLHKNCRKHTVPFRECGRKSSCHHTHPRTSF